VLQEQAVGVYAARLDVLPVATWRAPKQLRTLIIRSIPKHGTVVDLSFPPGSQLRCLAIVNPENLCSSTFVNLNQLQLFQLLGACIPNLPDTLVAHAHSLRVLELSVCTVSELPCDLDNLTQLTVIRLLYCSNLQRLPVSITKLQRLQLLEVDTLLGKRLTKREWNAAESMPQSLTTPVTDTDMSGLPASEGTVGQVQYGWLDMPVITEWLDDRFDVHHDMDDDMVAFTAKADQ
jgi:hypothetical protein